MRLSRTKQIVIRLAFGLSLMGTLPQVGCLEQVVRNVNPCGTILNCDPVEYDLLFADYPDFDRDPTCTIPGACGVFPYPAATGGGGGQPEIQPVF